MEHLKIGEIAAQVGVNPSTLRYYESIGLLPKPRRTNGIRAYSPDIIGRIKLIQFAQRLGFTLGEIKALVDGLDTEPTPAALWQTVAAQKLVALEEMIRHAQQMQELLRLSMACGCLELESCELILRG